MKNACRICNLFQGHFRYLSYFMLKDVSMQPKTMCKIIFDTSRLSRIWSGGIFGPSRPGREEFLDRVYPARTRGIFGQIRSLNVDTTRSGPEKFSAPPGPEEFSDRAK